MLQPHIPHPNLQKTFLNGLTNKFNYAGNVNLNPSKQSGLCASFCINTLSYALSQQRICYLDKKANCYELMDIRTKFIVEEALLQTNVGKKELTSWLKVRNGGGE